MFHVTYAIVTQESAEHGDAEEYGFIDANMNLRDALDSVFETRTPRCDGIREVEAGDRWASVHNGMEYETGAYESRSIHWPKTITDSSLNRVLRLMDKRAGFKVTRA